MYEQLGDHTKVSRGTLPAGDAGTRKTLAIMRGLAEEGARDLTVRETAIAIVKAAGAAAHDNVAELRALFEFVRDRIRFTNDILGVETLQGAEYTLRTRAGDCDDRAVLLVALAQSIGIPADFAFRVVALKPNAPRSFSHVYVVARLKGKRIAMDTTYPVNLMGWQYPHPFRSAEVTA
jgi:transglutaminase-like putative cysteine protease